jgi:hypothetical protein
MDDTTVSQSSAPVPFSITTSPELSTTYMSLPS